MTRLALRFLALAVVRPGVIGGAVVQFTLSRVDGSPQLAFYYVANAAFQTAGTSLASRRNLPRLNWPCWMRRDNSMPAMVIAAVVLLDQVVQRL